MPESPLQFDFDFGGRSICYYLHLTASQLESFMSAAGTLQDALFGIMCVKMSHIPDLVLTYITTVGLPATLELALQFVDWVGIYARLFRITHLWIMCKFE